MFAILSPALTMRVDPEGPEPWTEPEFLEEARAIMDAMRALSLEERKSLWGIGGKLLEKNVLALDEPQIPGAALFSYTGLAYQQLAANVMTQGEIDYLQSHLRILSGLYGILRPMDAIVFHRLEMKTKNVPLAGNLYDFWGDRLFRALEGAPFVSLCSKEYERALLPHVPGDYPWVQCIFEEVEGGRSRQKATYAKRARGEMVRYMAQNRVESFEELKGFSTYGYEFQKEDSDEHHYLFRAFHDDIPLEK
ncbi:MAG: YaaA family protein [Tissierellia bacterium]|nr:YaaA family protein [Tissierellia bacterium]